MLARRDLVTGMAPGNPIQPGTALTVLGVANRLRVPAHLRVANRLRVADRLTGGSQARAANRVTGGSQAQGGGPAPCRPATLADRGYARLARTLMPIPAASNSPAITSNMPVWPAPV